MLRERFPGKDVRGWHASGPHFVQAPGASSKPRAARIHPTAVVSPEAEIAENVEIGAFCYIEGKVKIGPDCVIRPGVYIYGPCTIGRNNTIHTGSIIGDKPQHLKYNNEPTSVEIGDNNIFRENVTIHRGTSHSMKTTVGHNCFFMVGSHVAHDCVIGNRVILTNGALLGGHCVVEDNVIISGNAAVHQFCRVGRLSMLSGCSATTKDMPPFVIQQGVDNVVGVNVIGMKRNGMSYHQIDAVRRAFRMIFRQGLTLPVAIAKMELELGSVDVVREMITFLSRCNKGINQMRSRNREEAA
ncbi:MAG: acyl-ACP--UDP-N-acetylglucosamine O-acyltransferase [Gemmataceae bacterium]